jgi:DNA-binding NtrC family response regulator
MDMERQYKLLIVDADDAFREKYQRYFQEQGFIVETAIDAETALTKLRDGEFDVTLTEIRLPAMSGLEMVKQAKKAGIDTGFIIITAYGERHDAIQAIKAGVEDWFDKSDINLDILLKRAIEVAEVFPLEEIERILSGIPDED